MLKRLDFFAQDKVIFLKEKLKNMLLFWKLKKLRLKKKLLKRWKKK